MKLLKTGILIIVWCFGATALYAQATNAKDTLYENRYKGIIKIAPLSFINEISLTYEHSIKKRYSLETTIGYMIDWKRKKRGIYNLTSYPFLDEGIVVRNGLKIYHKSKPGTYFSPRLMYKYVFYNKKTVLIDAVILCTFCEIQVRSARSHVIALQFLWGKQVYGKRLTADFYYGVGIKTKFGKNILYQRCPGYAYGFGECEDICKSCPYSENVFKELDFPIIPSIHLGLRLGYAFNIYNTKKQ